MRTRVWGKFLQVIAVCLVFGGSLLLVLGNASAAPSTWPWIGGTWTTESTACGYTPCGATWTFTPVTPGEKPPYAYNIAMGGVGKGFYAKNVTVAGDGSATFRQTCEGCRGYNEIIVKFSTANNKNEFAGTWQPFNPHSNAPNAPIEPEPGEAKGKITGKRIDATRAPDAPSGTSDWPPAKCKRIYRAWARTHPRSTRAAKRTETAALDKKHGCSL
jgi:hypothetical protein